MVKDLDKIAIVGGLALLLFGSRFLGKSQSSFNQEYNLRQDNKVFSEQYVKNVREIDKSILQNIQGIEKVENYANRIFKLEKERSLQQIDFITNQQQEARRTISEIQAEIIRLNPFHTKRLRSPDLQFKLKQQVRDRRAELFNASEQRQAATEFLDVTDREIESIRQRVDELNEYIF